MSLKQKLFELQKKHLRIGKNAEAWSGGKWSYKYATLDKIWDEIQDDMDKLGILNHLLSNGTTQVLLSSIRLCLI